MIHRVNQSLHPLNFFFLDCKFQIYNLSAMRFYKFYNALIYKIPAAKVRRVFNEQFIEYELLAVTPSLNFFVKITRRPRGYCFAGFEIRNYSRVIHKRNSVNLSGKRRFSYKYALSFKIKFTPILQQEGSFLFCVKFLYRLL